MTSIPITLLWKCPPPQKLNKLDTIESTMGALSTSVEEIKVESATAKEEVDAMKKKLKEVKNKNRALVK